MIYCYNCGSSLTDDMVFCGDCGTKNKDTVEQTEITPPVTSQRHPNIQQHFSSRTEETIQSKSFCRNCGNSVLKQAFACMACGLEPLKGKLFCQCCGANSHPEAVICIKCGVMLDGKPETKNLVAETALALSQPLQVQTQHVMPTSPPNYTQNYQQNITIIGRQKSVGTAVLLAFFFGPLGLLYTSVAAGLIMMVISFISFFVLPIIGPTIVWLICIIWAGVETDNQNSKFKDEYLRHR
jgi:hypothetical protein